MSEDLRGLEERLVTMGRLVAMLLEFATKEANEALVTVKALREALVLNGSFLRRMCRRWSKG